MRENRTRDEEKPPSDGFDNVYVSTENNGFMVQIKVNKVCVAFVFYLQV